ncbi:hypothetical protein [Ideonella margarita]|uniref:Uncharacterized protein n=1 Tax=Ideonella margarita TaxID=2984191 RepID=A0ABU9C7K0_9BURK
MKTTLIGGPCHLQVVEVALAAQSFESLVGGLLQRYTRRLWMDGNGSAVKAFYVHVDLSDGEADVLMMMQAMAV